MGRFEGRKRKGEMLLNITIFYFIKYYNLKKEECYLIKNV